MSAQTFTPSVDTTFLPKTHGLVFEPRLKMRSDKGRVYGGVEITLPDAEAYEPLVRREDPGLDPTNVYEVGETIYATSGTFTGGSTETLYRSRFQYRVDLAQAFIKEPWEVHSNVSMVFDYVIPEGALEVRLQTQAKDSSQETDDTENFFTTTIPIVS